MERKTANINKIFGRFIWIGIGLSAFFWIIESLIHTYIFHQGNLSSQIFNPDPNEIWMRFLVVCLLILFSVYAQFMINRRKRAEALHRDAEKNFRNFFNAMDHLIFILDEKRCILHMNDVAANRLGYTEGELLGKKLLEVHPPERREEANTILDEMVAGTANLCLIPIKTKDGQNIPVLDQ